MRYRTKSLVFFSVAVLVIAGGIGMVLYHWESSSQKEELAPVAKPVTTSQSPALASPKREAQSVKPAPDEQLVPGTPAEEKPSVQEAPASAAVPSAAPAAPLQGPRPVVPAPKAPKTKFAEAAFVSVSSKTVTGEWHAYICASQRRPRTRHEIAAVIRKDDRSVLCVPSAVIMEQVAKQLQRGEWESVDDFADWIDKSQDVSEIACTPDLLADYFLGRRSTGNERFDFTWTRTRCDKGETFLVYKEKAFLSGSCLNLLIQKIRKVETPLIEACVEIPVAAVNAADHREALDSVSIHPRLLVWGYENPNPGCGLKKVECECVDPDLGPVSAAYDAPAVTGRGTIRVPREMAKNWKQFCIKVPGFNPERGVKVGPSLIDQDVRPLVRAGEKIILPHDAKGKASINFWQ